MQFKTLAITIAAIQLTLDNAAEVQDFLKANGDVRPFGDLETAAVIDNPRGILVAKPGDYVVRASETDVYPMSESEFLSKYQPAEDQVDTGAALTEALSQLKTAEKRVTELTQAQVTAVKLADDAKKQISDLQNQVADLQKQVADLQKQVVKPA